MLWMQAPQAHHSSVHLLPGTTTIVYDGEEDDESYDGEGDDDASTAEYDDDVSDG